MKLKWFQIKNFRSIVDSGKCYVNNDITVFAGKNESGKSNILQALKAFHDGEFDEEYDFNMNDSNPELIQCYSVSEKEIHKIYMDILKYKSDYEFERKIGELEYDLIIHKDHQSIVNVEGNWLEVIEEIRQGELQFWERKISTSVINVIKNNKDLPDSVIEELKVLQLENKDTYGAAKLLSEKFQDQSVSDANIKKILDEYSTASDFEDKISDFDNIILPKVILFSSFTDLLPEKADKDTAKTSNIIQSFFKIVDISSDSIFSESSRQKRTLLVNQASTRISGDFSNFYKQNEVNIRLDVDGDELSFYLYDGANVTPFKPEQRSQGFQWFLSFYITLVAEKLSSSSIILLDEPGLYLHAKAQQDMLEVLESLAKTNQILFTTHSPYLIDTNRLDRLRLVIKNENTTYIENKFHKVSDRDTLTPIITAIGYDLSTGISLNSDLNVIVEGISDYYYLQAVKSFIELKTRFTIIPSIGVDQIPNIASILFGWGVPFVCLLDNDQQGRSVSRKLTRFGYEENREFMFISDKKLIIEDLFSTNDFYEHILLEPKPENQSESNSSLSATGGKVLLARRFFDRISSKQENISLDVTTIKNFQALFHKIDQRSFPNLIAN
ncbi:AAA family ATPase [Paenibacillus lutrae]|uniref:AAA family ATPase n=1 Tax=Paenibacillus lutrae TaxID=2078573 RepID=UPI0012FA7C7F|nr:AAA family ATPase [Paenibacillus lutrae]